MEIKASFGIDGAAARHGSEYFVVLNPGTANDRLRLNAAHEVAHLLYEKSNLHSALSDAAVEKRAYSFATELLLPCSQLIEAFDGRSFLKLIKYKEKFGISLAAMIYKAEQLRIINTTAFRWLWAELGRRGWRPNEPGTVRRDRAIEFETMLECAVQKKKITWLDAERITGIRESELRDRIAGVMQLDHNQQQVEHTEEVSLLQFEQLRTTV
jgi:Zn-dependent peptidase ImmA (M78 family)